MAGSDGLAVEEWQVSPNLLDLPALCAEMAQFFKESGRITGENGLGPSKEVFVAGEKGFIFAARVDGDYILLLVADPAAVPGKCRFQMRQSVRRARELL